MRLQVVCVVVAFIGCTGPVGPAGPEGPQGLQGVQGPQGMQGPAGSPDTPAQVLSKLNTAVRDGGTADLQLSAVYATVAASYPVNNVTFTTVPYATISYDKLGEFNGTTSRFTATRAGEYLVCASAWAGAAMAMELDLFKNGTRNRGFAVANNSAVVVGCGPIHLNASDFVEVDVYQSSGGPQTFPPNPVWAWLTINRIG